MSCPKRTSSYVLIPGASVAPVSKTGTLPLSKVKKRDWRQSPPSNRKSPRRRSASVAEQHTACAVKAFLPIAFLHVGNFDFTAAARRVHEALIADIDANMGIGLLARIEKYEIARLQIGFVHFFADLAHCLRIARED